MTCDSVSESDYFSNHSDWFTSVFDSLKRTWLICSEIGLHLSCFIFSSESGVKDAIVVLCERMHFWELLMELKIICRQSISFKLPATSSILIILMYEYVNSE